MTTLIGYKSAGTGTKTSGVIAIILGILAMLAPTVTGVSISILLGLLVLGGGIVQVVSAFRAPSFGKGLPPFAIGGLAILCGILLVVNPLFISRLLTVVLTAYFILDGIVGIVAGSRRKPEAGWRWLLFGGIVSILLGVLIWAQSPLSGAWAMGILLGIKLVFIGITMVKDASAASPEGKG